MEIALTPEQELLLRYGLEAGRIQSAEDALRQAPGIWEELKRDRSEMIAWIEEADADFAAGRYTEYDEEGLREFFEQVKREGRQRMARAAS
jgi:hypothetical protein